MPTRSVDVFQRIRSLFMISSEDERVFMRDFVGDMNAGLCGRNSSLKMIPTFVDVPTGNEKGIFIALDLGGTNFRIVRLSLKGSGKMAEPHVMTCALRREHMTGEGRKLFDFIASCIKKFLRKQRISYDSAVSLGFTFSFPIDQTAIDAGRLICWTKGFSARGVVGRDVVTLLSRSLAKKGLTGLCVSALVNDTVGTLAAHAYSDPTCDIGVILGTGTNACYVEQASAIKKARHLFTPSGKMVINIEWGNFDKLPMTPYDHILDRTSKNPGAQRLEKMVSGMYLGEIVRLVICDLYAQRAIFHSCGIGAFGRKDSFETAFVSALEGKDKRASANVYRVMGVVGASQADRELLAATCELVSCRAARMSALAVMAILKKIDPRMERMHTIAIDGSLYEKHPHFSQIINLYFKKILGSRHRRIKCALSKDGSGKGAAVIAAIASRAA